MTRVVLGIVGVALWIAASGCQNPLAAISWERMIDQSRGKPYKSSPYFSDGRLMRPPPAGTIPIDQPTGSQPWLTGLSATATGYTSAIPMHVDRATLLHGENRYDVFCATCHGVDGSGDSIVARNMTLRKPPSLVADPVRSFAPGRIFQVITAGYGLMPSYAMQLSIDDRWAVVSYLRALQLSASAELATLPPAARQAAQQALR